MSADTDAKPADMKERVKAAGALAQTMGQAGAAKLRSTFSGFGAKKAAAGTGEAGEATATAATGEAGAASAEASGIGTRKEAAMQRLSGIMGSRMMFNGAIGLLTLLAIVQWSLIVFNYWR